MNSYVCAMIHRCINKIAKSTPTSNSLLHFVCWFSKLFGWIFKNIVRKRESADN